MPHEVCTLALSKLTGVLALFFRMLSSKARASVTSSSIWRIQFTDDQKLVRKLQDVLVSSVSLRLSEAIAWKKKTVACQCLFTLKDDFLVRSTLLAPHSQAGDEKLTVRVGKSGTWKWVKNKI